MRVVFYGTPEFAVPTLDALLGAGHEVVLVVAQPDRPAGRGNTLRPPPVAVRAKELALSLAQPKAVRSGPFPARVTELAADVSVVVAYGRILTRTLLDAQRFGCINVHASLLPRWRGAAPIQHALWAGDVRTGVCTQHMVEALDEGPLFVVRQTPIAARETQQTLHDRLSLLAAEVAVETLALLPGMPTPQSNDGVTFAPKIEKQHGVVDLSGSALAIDRQVRALFGWPTAVLQLTEGPSPLKLHEVLPCVEGEAMPAGTVLSVDPLVVATGEGALELVSVQAPGKKPVTGRDYANGRRLAVGDRLS